MKWWESIISKFLLAALLFTLIAAPLPAAPLVSPFALTVVLNQNSILPYEPLGVVITLRNVSAQAQTLKSFAPGVFAGLELRSWPEGEWRPYQTRRQGGSMPAVPLPPKTFQPQEAVSEFITLHMAYDDTSSDFTLHHFFHPFAKPGLYEVRARNFYLSAESSPVRLEVKEPKGEDKQAYLFCSKNLFIETSPSTRSLMITSV